MISPIQLTPNMDSSVMASSINNTFQQIESENRTKTILDSSGNRQIVIGLNDDEEYAISVYDGKNEILRIGRLPNGVYGMAIAKPGYTIQDAIKPS